MGRRAWAINSRLSFSDLVYDRKRQDVSILVTTSIAMIIAEIVSCQAEVRDGEKNGRAHFQALKHLELLARDWFKSAAWLGAVCQFPQTSFELHNLETHLPTAITQPHPAPRGLTTSQHDVSTDTAAVHATMYNLPPPYHRS
jgi:hypothetical protein